MANIPLPVIPAKTRHSRESGNLLFQTLAQENSRFRGNDGCGRLRSEIHTFQPVPEAMK